MIRHSLLDVKMAHVFPNFLQKASSGSCFHCMLVFLECVFKLRQRQEGCFTAIGTADSGKSHLACGF
jgi:hypothetical protein